MTEHERAPTLRPLSVADLVDEIFRLYRRNFGLLFGLSAIIWLPASILIVTGLAIIGDVTPRDPLPSLPDLTTGFAVLLVAVVVATIALPILLAAVTGAASDRYLGRATTIEASLRRALGCYWRIVGAYILVFLAIIAVILGLGLVAASLAFLVGGVASILVAFAYVVGTIAALIWITVTWSFIAQAVVVEDAGALGAMRRSRRLVAGSRWRVIGINLLLVLIQVVLFSIPSSFVALVLVPIQGNAGVALANLVGAFAQVLYYPVQLGTLTLLYYDLRVRKEGFDLALAAERLREA